MFCSTSNFMYSVKNALDVCMVLSVYLIFDIGMYIYDHMIIVVVLVYLWLRVDSTFSPSYMFYVTNRSKVK